MADQFIRVHGTHLMREGAPYRFVGTNMWFGAYLGAAGPAGQRDRLCRELDLLLANGITNIRAMASSESSVLPAAVRPPILRTPDEPDEDLLSGLDFLLAALAERRMHAVLYLTNFWDWSGGMSSYNAWTDGGQIPVVPGADGSWEALVTYTASFYANRRANALYRAQVHRIVTRTNTINGRIYRDDPTIMAWQLANEPRPGVYGPSGEQNLPAFISWLSETAAFIHALDPHHLVSTGSEGTAGCLGSAAHFLAAHRARSIDYLTCHCWPYNWQWFDPRRPDATLQATLEQSRAYVEQHRALAMQLGKPLVLEEYGLPRDGGAVGAGSPTTVRDGFFSFLSGVLLKEYGAGSPLAGSNFWTWDGEGRVSAPSGADEPHALLPGEPPHEPEGLNAVYDTDATTLAILREHALALGRLDGPGMLA